MSPQVTTILPIYRLFMSVFKNNLIGDQLSCTAVLVVHCRGTLFPLEVAAFGLQQKGVTLFLSLLLLCAL